MNPRGRPRHSGAVGAGFSLVELITILAMLGILAAVVFPRFADSRGYADILLKDQLLTSAGFARQAALGRHNQTVTLALSRPGDWLFNVRVDTDGDGVADLLLKQQRLESDASLVLTSPSIVVSTTPVVVAYDNLGNLTTLNGAPLTANLAFVTADRILCLSLAGHAYEATSADDCADN